MKNENNFLLYSIGSAFLLVAGAVILSVPGNSGVYMEYTQTASVSDGFDFEQLDEAPVGDSSISGRVYLDVDKDFSFSSSIDVPFANQKVYLYDRSEDFLFGLPRKIAYTHMDGTYTFEKLPTGTFSITTDTPHEGVVMAFPKSLLDSIDESRHFTTITTVNPKIYKGNDFVLQKINPIR